MAPPSSLTEAVVPRFASCLRLPGYATREFQRSFYDSVFVPGERPKSRVLVAPTGAGKTRAIVAMAYAAYKLSDISGVHHGLVVILVTDALVADDLRIEFIGIGAGDALVNVSSTGGRAHRPDRGILILTYQRAITLANGDSPLLYCGALFLDEAHRARAREWRRSWNSIRGGPHGEMPLRVAVSATFGARDERVFNAPGRPEFVCPKSDCVVVNFDRRTHGWIETPRLVDVICADSREKRHALRSILSRAGAGGVVIVYVRRHAVLHALARKHAAAVITGETPHEERVRILRTITANSRAEVGCETVLFCQSLIGQTSWDIPDLKTIVQFDPVKRSDVGNYQTAGRLSRRHPAKETKAMFCLCTPTELRKRQERVHAYTETKMGTRTVIMRASALFRDGDSGM